MRHLLALALKLKFRAYGLRFPGEHGSKYNLNLSTLFVFAIGYRKAHIIDDQHCNVDI